MEIFSKYTDVYLTIYFIDIEILDVWKNLKCIGNVILTKMLINENTVDKIIKIFDKLWVKT